MQFDPIPHCSDANECQERQRIQYARGQAFIRELVEKYEVALLRIEEAATRPDTPESARLATVYMTAVAALGKLGQRAAQ
jgi:hypothetical protein